MKKHLVSSQHEGTKNTRIMDGPEMGQREGEGMLGNNIHTVLSAVLGGFINLFTEELEGFFNLLHPPPLAPTTGALYNVSVDLASFRFGLSDAIRARGAVSPPSRTSRSLVSDAWMIFVSPDPSDTLGNLL